MKQIGNRIVFDQDGEIILQTGEMQGDVLDRKVITKLGFIDIPFGFIDFNTHYIESIDIESNTPIVKQYEVKLTEEELKMQALEKRNADLAYDLMMSKGGN